MSKRNGAMPKPAWQNRIVGHGEEDPEQLLANPRNWRSHPKHQQDALAGVLDQVGFVQSVMVNRRSGFVVDGHARVALAISRHQPTVPVVYVDLDDDEEGMVLATLDPIGALAGSDSDQLSMLLASLKPTDGALSNLLATLRQDLPEQFPEFDESVADGLVLNECPACGHKWPA